MVDPYAITNFNRTESELQEFWLFCMAVAGKKATMIAGKIGEFLEEKSEGATPFDYVRRLVEENRLRERMMAVKLGKYALLEKGYAGSVSADGPDFTTAPADRLQEIQGVGFKTSRFFVLHSRRDADVAVIDTHVLKYLASLGHQVPSTIPTGDAYLALEKIMLTAARTAGMSMAEFDLRVWKHYASNGQHPLPGTEEPMRAAA
jgi:thermostable 8-oxoguanine DNA glycosylase